MISSTAEMARLYEEARREWVNIERRTRPHGFGWIWVAVLAGHLLGVLAICGWLLR